MSNLYKSIILVLLSLLSFNLKATHFAGSDLTYKCLGGNFYQISISLYRDCSGVAAPVSINLWVKCKQDSTHNFIVTLQPVSGTGQEITQSCSAISTYCNGGNGYGVQEYVYEGNVTLVPCKNWTMSYSSCCRNPVTTVPNNTSNGWFITASLNNLDAPGNSSPKFSNKPPILVQINSNFTFNHGAIDSDGDSLSYSFYTPYTIDTNTSIIYNSGYSDTNFLISSTAITLDKHSGEINFSPTIEELTVTGIQVDEWRKINGIPTCIGTVYRDMQLMTYYSNNHLPKLSGMDFSLSHQYNPNDTMYKLVVPFGIIIFDINGFDLDTANPNVSGNSHKFRISWNNGIPNANFTVHNNGTDSAYANFESGYFSNFLPYGTHKFTATITDEACPYNGSQTFTYEIVVNPPAGEVDNQGAFIDLKTIILPNPNNGSFDLKIIGDFSKPINYQILNISGSVIENGIIENQGQQTSKYFSKNTLPNGIYFIKLQNEYLVKTERIIIQ